MATAFLSFETTPSDLRLDRSFRYMGNLMTIHADSQDTNGQFALVEANGMPGGEPPLHVHTKEDELFYVLEGKVKVYRGKEELIRQAGESGFLPRNVPHTFRIMSAHARMLVYITPGGFENFFREMSQLALGPVSSKPTLAQISSIAKQYGVSFIL